MPEPKEKTAETVETKEVWREALETPDFFRFLQKHNYAEELDPSSKEDQETIERRFCRFKEVKEVVQIIGDLLKERYKKEFDIDLTDEQLAIVQEKIEHEAITNPFAFIATFETVEHFKKLSVEIDKITKDIAVLEKDLSAGQYEEVKEKKEVLTLAGQVDAVDAFWARVNPPEKRLKKLEEMLRQVELPEYQVGFLRKYLKKQAKDFGSKYNLADKERFEQFFQGKISLEELRQNSEESPLVAEAFSALENEKQEIQEEIKETEAEIKKLEARKIAKTKYGLNVPLVFGYTISGGLKSVTEALDITESELVVLEDKKRKKEKLEKDHKDHKLVYDMRRQSLLGYGKSFKAIHDSVRKAMADDYFSTEDKIAGADDPEQEALLGRLLKKAGRMREIELGDEDLSPDRRAEIEDIHKDRVERLNYRLKGLFKTRVERALKAALDKTEGDKIDEHTISAVVANLEKILPKDNSTTESPEMKGHTIEIINDYLKTIKVTDPKSLVKLMLLKAAVGKLKQSK